MKYKYSVLTAIFGNYEPVREVPFHRDDIEFVCVTDNPEAKSETWKIIIVPKGSIWLFDVKHNPYKYVSTDVCLWIDASVQILDDPTNAIMPFINSDKEMMIGPHLSRHNVYEELTYWVKWRNISVLNAMALVNQLVPGWGQESKYHTTDTLFQTTWWLTKNTESIKDMYEKTRELEHACSIESIFRDDQTILSVIISTYFYKWDKLLLVNTKNVLDCRYFRWYNHGTNIPQLFTQENLRCFDEEQTMLYCLK